MNKTPRVVIGNTEFALPFRQSGLWVTDSRGKNLCECPSQPIAKGLAASLNTQHFSLMEM
jgi:hypothetical protein